MVKFALEWKIICDSCAIVNDNTNDRLYLNCSHGVAHTDDLKISMLFSTMQVPQIGRNCKCSYIFICRVNCQMFCGFINFDGAPLCQHCIYWVLPFTQAYFQVCLYLYKNMSFGKQLVSPSGGPIFIRVNWYSSQQLQFD